MMKKMPKDSWSFMYIDIDAFRTDTDLEETYRILTGREDGFGVWADTVGIEFRDIDSFSGGGRDFGDMAMLFEGDFNLDEVREKLVTHDQLGTMIADEYRGIAVWAPEYSEDREEFEIALVSSNLIILGRARNCIDAIIDSNVSMYGNKNTRDVVERLPDGIVVGFHEDGLRIENFYSAYEG